MEFLKCSQERGEMAVFAGYFLCCYYPKLLSVYHNQQILPLRTVGLTYMLMILFCLLQVHPEGKFVVDLDKSIDMSEVMIHY